MIGARERTTIVLEDAEPASRTTGPSVFVWIATAAVAIAGAGAYMVAYAFHHMQPVGWDVFGYAWQTNAIGHASLGSVGSRPGMPALASLLRSVAPLPTLRALVVLPIVLAVALALAATASVRSSLRTRPWLVPVLVGATLLWPGTARMLAGYEASLLLLVLLAAAAGLLVQAGGRPVPLAIVASLFLAASLTHIAIFAAGVVVVALYALLSLPDSLRARRQGASLLETDSGAAAATIVAGGAAGVGLLFGALGFRPRGTVNVGSVSFLFRGRTIAEIRRARPWTSVPAAAIGAVAAWVGAGGLRSGLRDGPARAIVRLGVAWLLVAGAGVFAGLLGWPVPGARFLLFALPLPLLAGLGLGAVAWLVAGASRSGHAGASRGSPGSVIRIAVAVAVVAGASFGLARTGYRFIQTLYTQTSVTLTAQLGAAAAYARVLPGHLPVVIVVDEPGPTGAYTPKLRLNVIRAAMPADLITRTFVFVGRSEDLLAGRPTLLPPSSRWRRAYDQVSRDTLATVRPALADGAVVLMLERYDRLGFARLMAADPTRTAADGVYVVRGPLLHVAPPIRTGPFEATEASLSGLWMLLVLGVAGWGYARAALPRERASALDVTCIAPAVGTGVIVLAAFGIAALGGDPSGPLGIVALVVVAGAGLTLGIRSEWGRGRDRPFPTVDTDATDAADVFGAAPAYGPQGVVPPAVPGCDGDALPPHR